jgi:hypothetical protein
MYEMYSTPSRIHSTGQLSKFSTEPNGDAKHSTEKDAEKNS